MSSVAISDPPVNPMTTGDMKREATRAVAFRRAAEYLAIAVRGHLGVPTAEFGQLPPHQMAFFRATAQGLIETFAAIVDGRETPREGEVRRASRESAITIQRQIARIETLKRGHDLSVWRSVAGHFHEDASCQRCGRIVVIVVTEGPQLRTELVGSALTDGCLVATAQEGA
ncbi:MAG TPA: hypothetical protein VNJ04_08140 [Gemmatimonadaceae bacterium]|nr:hypothetical protein [Gemmatimonadaceae bacterium]